MQNYIAKSKKVQEAEVKKRGSEEAKKRGSEEVFGEKDITLEGFMVDIVEGGG